MNFTLHPQLEKDSAHVCDLSLCRVQLMNDSRFPWLVLVPMRDGLRELFDLSAQDYTIAMAEVREVTERFSKWASAYKMNVAALGNMVPQLHIHIIARAINDSAWPAPIWSSPIPAQPYLKDKLELRTEEIRRIFA